MQRLQSNDILRSALTLETMGHFLNILHWPCVKVQQIYWSVYLHLIIYITISPACFGLYWAIFFSSMSRQPYMGPGLLVSSRFHGHTHSRHTTIGRTPLDEGPARRKDLYLTTHNTHKRKTYMLPVGFEPTILVSERPKTHALERTWAIIREINIREYIYIWVHSLL
jgi:hypothetical protein